MAPNKRSASKSVVQVWVPSDLKDLAVAKAEMEGRPLSDVITDLLRGYVSR